MQSAYIAKLMEIASSDANVLHLLADSGTGYDEMFRRYCPSQIFNFGISEENMVAAAAGMATVGKIPFVFTAGAFLAYRSLEFIRDDVCFQNLNVKIVGMGSGLSWSSLGPTHHTTEDIAVLRSLPNLMILSPATPRQAAECTEAAYRHNGPVYIRIGMNHEREFFNESYRLDLSENDLIRDGDSAVVYTTGSILDPVAEAADILAASGIDVRVRNVSSIKPFPVKNVLTEIKGFDRVFTVEEHNVHGGLASIIAETAAFNGAGVNLCPIGLCDCFADGYGTQPMVRRRNGLDAESIAMRIKEVLDNE